MSKLVERSLNRPILVEARAVQVKVRNTSTGQIEVISAIQSASGYLYELQTSLRKSIYGTVYRSVVLVEDDKEEIDIFQRTNYNVAIKQSNRNEIIKQLGKTIENPYHEIITMQCLQTALDGHDMESNLLLPLDCCQTEKDVYLITPFISGGEVFDVIVERQGLDRFTAKTMFKQLVNAVHIMHQLGYVHRDISPENILMNDEVSMFWLMDYGMTVALPCSSTQSNIFGTIPLQRCGKKAYMSPEQLKYSHPLQSSVYQPMLSDIWSMGVTLLVTLAGVFPFEMASESDEGFVCIARNHDLVDFIEGNNLQENFCKDSLDLIQGMLREIPEERLTMEQIINHPWLQ